MNSYSGLSCWLQELDRLKSREFKEVTAGKTKAKSKEMTWSLELGYRGYGKANGSCKAVGISSCALPDLLNLSRLLLLLLPLTKKKKARKLSASSVSRPPLFPKASRFLENSLRLSSSKQVCTGQKGKECPVCLWGDTVDPDGVLQSFRELHIWGEGPSGHWGEQRSDSGMCPRIRKVSQDKQGLSARGIYKLATEDE